MACNIMVEIIKTDEQFNKQQLYKQMSSDMYFP